MAQINVYSPFVADPLTENGRVAVQYTPGCGVSVGVQRATPDPKADGHPTYDENGGSWSDLDRNGCNNLIRAIREARDKAFGRDE